jgi:hypothetical protein
MTSHKAEETLHNYLRRHFERISIAKARQLPEQSRVLEVDFVPEAVPAHAVGRGNHES